MTATQFFLEDLPKTLFPTAVDRLLVENCSPDLADHAYKQILGTGGQTFLTQSRVYAAKPNWHLRRTFKLDPVAAYFLYDIVHRNRSIFRRPFRPTRQHFGYRFENGHPVLGTKAYGDFRASVNAWRTQYSHCISFDIASYFNSIYHHDLVSWFSGQSVSSEDGNGFGRFLREINAGRSIDCLPQGLYPAKMLGSAFLVEVDLSSRLRCGALGRFMDDFYLFDNDERVLREDLLQIQRLLGARGLNLNPKKTRLFETADGSSTLHGTVDAIKVRLLQERRNKMIVSADPTDEQTPENVEEEEEEEEEKLTDEEREYLLALLQDDSLEEEDAELVLSLMGEHSEDVLNYIGAMIERFPNLAKRIYYFCEHVEDRSGLAEAVLSSVKGGGVSTEFQLFWLAWTVEQYLLETPIAGELLVALFEADGATEVSKAKVLEIPENRWGMPDLREEQLRTGHSSWLTWAAATGSRTQEPARRNHLLGYFSNASAMNRLVANCVRRLP